MSKVMTILSKPQESIWMRDEPLGVITRYEIGRLIDFPIPYIWVADHSFSQRVPLFGAVRFLFEKERYCTQCLQRNDTKDVFCSECQGTEVGILHSCIIKKEGSLSAECDIIHNSCGVPWLENYCCSEHVIYIGCVGDAIKVGVTKYSRNGVQERYIDRFLEQGLTSVAVLRGKEPLTMPEAQSLEDWISNYFGIPERIRFKEKLDAILELSDDGNTRAVESYAQDIAKKEFSGRLYVHNVLDLSGEYIVPKDWLGMYSRFKRELQGTVVGFFGNILFIQDLNQDIYAIDSYKLVGRKMDGISI